MEIDLSKPGAFEERSKLKRFHAVLNSPTLVPEQCYRPASVHYSLVCQINCIIALILSKNYEAIPPFVRGALRQLEERPPLEAAVAYYEMANRYLKQVVYVLRNFTAVSEESLLCWIPKHMLDMGPQVAPNNPFQPIAREDAHSG